MKSLASESTEQAGNGKEFFLFFSIDLDLRVRYSYIINSNIKNQVYDCRQIKPFSGGPDNKKFPLQKVWRKKQLVLFSGISIL